ncbi:hypothetical protein MSG28_001000 [Choristoneura fumiferana]|uniref:Uncharacterized protein n=1 Tax=Choristoneura fumiferana TaxID=7141 RepID=A0ACC0K389_CHOFU|nr:hypothetical protein MSG28_001000 [Choristoneura fumiferana]
MATDEDKTKIAKLLQGLEVPEVKLTERCHDLVKIFHEKFSKEVEEEEMRQQDNETVYENPYKVDPESLEENERKLRELLAESKRKEKLLRIDNELKRHHEKASEVIAPLAECDMSDLVKECQQETRDSLRVGADRLRDTVDAAKKNLPNFQYRKICSGQYLPRPDTRQCFLRSLGELRNLRVLALEYSHIADTTGGALLSILPVLKRPHFRLQLMCREDHIPGHTDAALGAGGHAIPDTAWRRVSIACPDLYLFIAFCRVRDYDNWRRFLSPSMPVRELHLQYGIDLLPEQRQDSDISCLIRHLAFHFASTLVTLSIHQWRFAVFPLRRVFELMPRLTRFYYVGKVEDEVDLHRMLQIISCGVCDKLKHLKVQIQDEERRRDYWINVINNLIREYKDIIIDLYDIHLCFSIYKN